MQYTFKVKKETQTTLDRFLASHARVSLEEACELVRFGAVWVDRTRETDGERTLEAGEAVTVHIPRYGVRRYYETDPERILYRDPWLLAYDKEAGIPSQPTPYDGYNNVFEALKRWLGSEPCAGGLPPGVERKDAGGSDTLALHHRLDMAVSGLMIFALSTRANAPLFEAFRDRQVEKKYRAVVCGEPGEDSWVERAAIGRQGGRYLCVEPGRGKEAETGFRVLRRAHGRALVEARPKTGRTHQIRLHLALRGLPILGDRQYGGLPYPRCMLHAQSLNLPHPVKSEPLVIEATLPDAFEGALV
mgnify:CR=1 FL=1